MANLPSSSSMLTRLLSNVISPFTVSKCSASGRWWPQPDSSSSRYYSTKNQVQPASASSTSPSSNENEVIVTPIRGVSLSKSQAAPVYSTPKSTDLGYELEAFKNDEMIANYTLFEAAINKAKVPWINYDGLTSTERTIHMAHMKAINNRKLTYLDPVTKYTVFTTSHHLNRRKCCGSGCRHCPYEMVNAKEEVRSKKVWNGAFYV